MRLTCDIDESLLKIGIEGLLNKKRVQVKERSDTDIQRHWQSRRSQFSGVCSPRFYVVMDADN